MIPRLRIVNVIASSHVKGQIDIEELSQVLSKVQYEPGTFPGLVYRRKGQPTIIMFSSGKISSHGAKSEVKAKNAIANTVQEIAELGCVIGSPELSELKIENVVATVDLKCSIKLVSIAQNLKNAFYNPKKFPGLIIKMKNSTRCLLFSTGKLVITGAKSEENIIKSFDEILAILKINSRSD